MAIINQNHPKSGIQIVFPDFKNLGVWLRVLLACSIGSLFWAILQANEPAQIGQYWAQSSVWVMPVCLLSLLLLSELHAYVINWPRPMLIAPLVVGLLSVGWQACISSLLNTPASSFDVFRGALIGVVLSNLLLQYLRLRQQALSPALAEARLQALQARIRPHFLFNSINGVLSLIRSEPRKAERALEDMADLFRVFMADNRELSTLKRELDLCWQYLELERLRLGDRLKIDWHTDKMPDNARVPPLVLQPLLENAVYHGIEPSLSPNPISINIYLLRKQVHLVVRNPYTANPKDTHQGNKMAMRNIEERLSLHFDAEASLSTQTGADYYQVHIVIPYVPVGALL